MINNKKAIKLREEGYTLQSIANHFSVTRQAVYWVVRHIQAPSPEQRQGSKERAKPNFDRRQWGSKYWRTHMKVNGKSVRVDKRPRPESCELCGKEAGKLDYHHWDDDCLEHGVWVCVRCHGHCTFVENGGYDKYTRLKKDQGD